MSILLVDLLCPIESQPQERFQVLSSTQSSFQSSLLFFFGCSSQETLFYLLFCQFIFQFCPVLYCFLLYSLNLSRECFEVNFWIFLTPGNTFHEIYLDNGRAHCQNLFAFFDIFFTSYEFFRLKIVKWLGQSKAVGLLWLTWPCIICMSLPPSRGCIMNPF